MHLQNFPVPYQALLTVINSIYPLSESLSQAIISKHRIHHEYNKHTNNYGDIVWWDMLFGTYENLKEFKSTCGFDHEKEQSLFDMLKFKDVHKS